jgi:hypothetical protein
MFEHSTVSYSFQISSLSAKHRMLKTKCAPAMPHFKDFGEDQHSDEDPTYDDLCLRRRDRRRGRTEPGTEPESHKACNIFQHLSTSFNISIHFVSRKNGKETFRIFLIPIVFLCRHFFRCFG